MLCVGLFLLRKGKSVILGYYDENNELQCRGKLFLDVSAEERKIINYLEYIK